MMQTRDQAPLKHHPGPTPDFDDVRRPKPCGSRGQAKPQARAGDAKLQAISS